jgi:DUF1680 family protein
MPTPVNAQRAAMAPGQVRLLEGTFKERAEINRRYLMALRSEHLLQNHYMEAGLWQPRAQPGVEMHWGWESPTCQLRGHFLGHWLSAAARHCASTPDPALRGKAEAIVGELARCQRENGGEWAMSIPTTYLDWIARGKGVWAPHYTIHKTLMGLYDMVAYLGSDLALEVLEKAARWFHRWTGRFSRQEMDDMLDVETGGMMEVWANLYGLTGKPEHLDLVDRYARRRLFDRLIAGDDPLTNRHANTTIPEAHGAARAYEVTGDAYWRQAAEAYWRCAFKERGAFCTGGQTTGEIWTPPFAFAARLGEKTQEHCVVYNMIRLADYLYRWSGDVAYADYVERNTYNGILAQQHPETGMIAYFLPLRAGSRKVWGTPTTDFWCCHGSLVQAHTTHNAYIYYEGEGGIALCQYIPSELLWRKDGVPVTVRQRFDREASGARVHEPDGATHRPSRWIVECTVTCEQPVPFALSLRLPWWLSGQATVTVNGEAQDVRSAPSSWHTIEHTWHEDHVRIVLPYSLSTCPLPDAPSTMALMEGPVVMAGLCDEGRTLVGDPHDPTTFLVPDNEREWGVWQAHTYRTTGQDRHLRFVPLYEVRDEPFTVYWEVREG